MQTETDYSLRSDLIKNSLESNMEHDKKDIPILEDIIDKLTNENGTLKRLVKKFF